jgi:hypothetical protein
MAQLDEMLDRPPCLQCKSGTLRPIDVVNGRVQIRCTALGCDSSVDIELPRLARKIIYLDTSTVSHMARAKDGPFSRLREAMSDAVYKNVIGCVASSLVRTEAELLRDPEAVFTLCRELATIRSNHPLRVEEAQIYRAFGRFLRSEAAVREIRPPQRDAFDDDVQDWHGNLSFHSRFPSRPAEIAQRREGKVAMTADFERIYGRYASDGLTFAEIEVRETDGLCNFLCSDVTFYKLVTSGAYRDMERSDAETQVRNFLRSDHVRFLPFAVINGRLQAILAISFRNANARRPKPGDPLDIEHLRTYAPYVDVLLTDGDMASLANKGNVRIGQDYGAIIRSLGASKVDEFIAWLGRTTSMDGTAALSAQVYDSIAEGGYLRDFAAFASRYAARLRDDTQPPT